MLISIPYGTGFMPFHAPDSRLRACIAPAHASAASLPEAETVARAIANPIASPPLRDLARGKRRILLITSDHTRPMPSKITLPLLLDEIRQVAPDAEITVLIATGLHRSPTEDELSARFGPLYGRERIVIHDARRESELRFFGVLPSGGELWLNRLVMDSDLTVAEGFIEPHFFAGFSGGRKSILPGVAGEKTVLYNHNARFIRHPAARQGVLAGNPIHADMAFAARQAGLQFILNVILDEQKRIRTAVAGDPEAAHAAGCALCEQAARAEAAEADIVITSNGGYPLDQNIYQAVKGLTAAESCVRPGGVIILCAALGDGHGGDAFFHWFADRPDARAVARDIEDVPPGETTADQWQAQILARVLQKAPCIFVTGAENRPLVEQMHMRWAPNADDALVQADALLGRPGDITVIPDGVGVIMKSGER